ncbi:MAG: hypothetical protein ACRD0L_12060 [Acidimicrobiales bacterium]
MLARAIGGEEARLRTGLVMAAAIGVLVGRYFLELDGLRDASPEEIVALLRPCFRSLGGGGARGARRADGRGARAEQPGGAPWVTWTCWRACWRRPGVRRADHGCRGVGQLGDSGLRPPPGLRVRGLWRDDPDGMARCSGRLAQLVRAQPSHG